MFEKSFITDCEGPLTLNDNAFEMAAKFIEDGDELFKVLSLYDDYLADIVKKENYKVGNTLKLMAINLSKTATDIRMMASGPNCGFNEVKLPVYERLDGLNCSQTSQSVPEIVNQVCFLIIGKETSITLACEHGEMEANAFASIVYSLIFDCLEYMRRALRLLREYCIEGMIINEEKCSESVENSDGIIVALLKKVDYQKCLEILERKVQTGKSIKEVCLEMNIMSEEKLTKLLTVDNIKVK